MESRVPEVSLSAKFIVADYIVRIYRFEKDKPKSLVGIVEEVGGEGKKAFTNYDELWEILISSKRTTGDRKKVRKEVK